MADTDEDKQVEEQEPRFGRLLGVCVAAVLFCGLLVWIAGTFLSDCCTFGFLERLFH